VPKVGQGVNYVLGWFNYQKYYNLKQTKLPQTKIKTIQKNGSVLQVYKTDRLVTKMHQVDTRYTNLQDIQEIQTIHTLGPSMPQVALTPLGLPSLAN